MDAGPIFEKHVGKATERNAVALRSLIRERIRSGGYKPNAPLTALIKGGSKALVGTRGADLWNSVAYDLVSWAKAVVGVKRTESWNGREYNIAEIVHDGITIKVTESMRALFHILWLAGLGEIPASKLTKRAKEIYDETKGAKGILPIGKNKTGIRIPPRPYLKDAFESPDAKALFQANWGNAVKAALKEMALKGKL